MRRRPKASFTDEVTARFDFLVREFGTAAPVYSDWRTPCVAYRAREFAYRVGLSETLVSVTVSRPTPGNAAFVAARLPDLVVAARMGPREAVRVSARTGAALLDSLDSLAAWARRIHPLVLTDEGIALLRRATTAG